MFPPVSTISQLQHSLPVTVIEYTFAKEMLWAKHGMYWCWLITRVVRQKACSAGLLGVHL